MSLFAIRTLIPSLMKCLLESSSLYYWSYKIVSVLLDAKPLADICFANFFSQSVSYLLILLNTSFEE